MALRTVRSADADRPRRRVALIAHDNKKLELAEWARFNRQFLADHDLVATGTTGRILEDQLGLPVTRVHSGPLGGDQQIGAMIAEGLVDLLVFFADPSSRCPTTPTSRLWCGWPWSGTSRSPATGLPPTSWCRRR